MRLLGFVAHHGRWCLVLGLLAGLGLPSVAQAIKPWLPHLIAALLLVSALRIGPKAALGGLGDLRGTFGLVLLYQLAAPLIALTALALWGKLDTPWALALLLVLSAPSVTGGANFAILLNSDPAPPLRLLLVGTALFPVTVIPVLWVMPSVNTIIDVVMGAGALLGVIFGAVLTAFAMRHVARPVLTEQETRALDGVSAILLGVVVIGLMSAVGPALRMQSGSFVGWLVFAVSVNFGLQVIAFKVLKWQRPGHDHVGASIVAGNRNVALFLVALPTDVTDALLLFIGCYQVPMYLTPIVMRYFYMRA